MDSDKTNRIVQNEWIACHIKCYKCLMSKLALAHYYNKRISNSIMDINILAMVMEKNTLGVNVIGVKSFGG